MFKLIDSFNNKLISAHRTYAAAELAQQKHFRKIKKIHGENSYLTYRIEISR